MIGSQPQPFEAPLPTEERLYRNLPEPPLIKAFNAAYQDTFPDSARHHDDPEYDEQRANAEQAGQEAIDQAAALIEEQLNCVAEQNLALACFRSDFMRDIFWGTHFRDWQDAFWRAPDPRVYVRRVFELEAHLIQNPQSVDILRERARADIEAGVLDQAALVVWTNDPAARWRAYRAYADIWGASYRAVDARGEGLTRCQEVLGDHAAKVAQAHISDAAGQEDPVEDDTAQLLAEHAELLDRQRKLQAPIKHLLAAFPDEETETRPKRAHSLPLEGADLTAVGVDLPPAPPTAQARVWVVQGTTKYPAQPANPNIIAS